MAKNKKVDLNKKELRAILSLLKNEDDNCRIRIKAHPTGISDKITVRIGDSKLEVDVSDYSSW